MIFLQDLRYFIPSLCAKEVANKSCNKHVEREREIKVRKEENEKDIIVGYTSGGNLWGFIEKMHDRYGRIDITGDYLYLN